MHYSQQAARWLNAVVDPRQDEFLGFKQRTSMNDILKFADTMLAQYSIPQPLKSETLLRLKKVGLTEHGVKLLFYYKTEFMEASRSK